MPIVDKCQMDKSPPTVSLPRQIEPLCCRQELRRTAPPSLKHRPNTPKIVQRSVQNKNESSIGAVNFFFSMNRSFYELNNESKKTTFKKEKKKKYFLKRLLTPENWNWLNKMLSLQEMSLNFREKVWLTDRHAYLRTNEFMKIRSRKITSSG